MRAMQTSINPLAINFCGLDLASPIVLLSGCVGFGEEYTRVEGYSNRDAGAIVDQCLAIPREVPELADGHWWHEAAPQQPMLQQLGDPHAVMDVRLPPRDLLDMRRIDEQAGEVALERVEHRLPIHAGTLHRHMRHPMGRQPVPEHQ